MTPPAHLPSLRERVTASAWAADEPGLVEHLGDLDDLLGVAHAGLSDTAVELTRPGPVSPTRVARHLTAVGLSRAIRLGTRLPTDLRELGFLRTPDAWARQAAAEAFADQLALGGAATADVARLIVNARRLFPSDIVDELAGRAITAPALDRARALDITERSVADLDSGTAGEVVALGARPLASLPLSQLHTGQLSGGRRVLVRVRRPGVARQVLADARMSGTFMAPLQQVMPQMGGLNPLAFLQLTTRHGLEAIDLRYEAINLAELALAVEEQGIEGLEVVRPVPGLTDERVLVTSSVDGVSLTRPHAHPDPELGLRALTALTLEPALVHGLFWADPAPEHLVVTRDGGLALVGVGAAGHLSPALRKAGIRFLTSVVSGDAEGQVEAMQLAGAVPPGTDLDALVDDLRSAETLQVSHILMGGETGLLAGLRDATRILLTHRLQPPLEVVMLLRTVFSLGELVDRVAPDSGGLMAALLPLLQQLPDLIAAAQIDEE